MAMDGIYAALVKKQTKKESKHSTGAEDDESEDGMYELSPLSPLLTDS